MTKKIAVLVLLSATSAVAQSVPAFPGAVGAGAVTPGGRGGTVCQVTNLNDSGAGSLRNCVVPATCGPRIVIFRTSGYIQPTSRLQVNCPFITIAGQTSPNGIWLGSKFNSDCLWFATHDIVTQYIGFTGDNNTSSTGPDGGSGCFEIASGGANNFNIVLDHNTARWYGNKAFAFLSNGTATQGIHNVSYLNNLVYEPICISNQNCHPVGSLGTDVTSGSGKATQNIDFWRNMIINFDHRGPLMQSAASVRFVNNIMSNWNQFAGLTMGGIAQDFIANKWVDGNLNAFNGPISLDTVHVLLGERGDNPDDLSDNCIGSNPCDNAGPPSWYLKNNIGRSTPTPFSIPTVPTGIVNDTEQLKLISQGTESGDKFISVPQSWLRSTPLPAETFPIVPDDVAQLDSIVTSTVGNSRHLDCNGKWAVNRQSDDTRVIQQYLNRQTGQEFWGQFSSPAIPTGTPCPLDPVNSLPLGYEQANNIAAGTPSNVPDAKGFTLFDYYLAGMSPGPTPPPATCTTFAVNCQVKTTTTVNVRPSAGGFCGPSGVCPQQPAGSLGTLAAGPQTANGFPWWNVTFTSGPSGWVGQDSLVLTGNIPISVTVSCTPSVVAVGGTVLCTATVNGTPNTGVTWSSSAGTISQGGTLTNLTVAGLVTVTATSQQDPTKSGTAPVTVTSATTRKVTIMSTCDQNIATGALSNCVATPQ